MIYHIKKIAKFVLPGSIANQIRRWKKRRLANKRKRARERAIARFGTIGPVDIVGELRKCMPSSDCVIFAQCSFNDLHTFRGSPTDLLQALQLLAGKTGTLLMPAFTSNTFSSPPKSFDVNREPTNTGIVNEMFRRTAGVIRSLHPRHSICGSGPMATTILSGHENCLRADGPESPFDRLRQLDNSFILTLGLPPGFVSLLHWVEDIEPSKFPIALYRESPVTCQVVDAKGGIRLVEDWVFLDKMPTLTDFSRIPPHLSKCAMRFWDYKGISIGLYHTKTLADELIALRDRGIIHYRSW
jgi:aminoglycoside 3-N-acetyltransferase